MGLFAFTAAPFVEGISVSGSSTAHYASACLRLGVGLWTIVVSLLLHLHDATVVEKNLSRLFPS